MPGRSRRRWRGRARMEPVAPAAASAQGRKRSVVRARARPRSPTHERLVALHPPPDRDLVARDRRHRRTAAEPAAHALYHPGHLSRDGTREDAVEPPGAAADRARPAGPARAFAARGGVTA